MILDDRARTTGLEQFRYRDDQMDRE